MFDRPAAVQEPAAQQLVEATADPLSLVDAGPGGTREILDDPQSEPVEKPPVTDGWVTVPAAVGDVRVRIVKLVVGAHAAVVFVEYTPSPEAHHRVAIEQGYAVAQRVIQEGATHGPDPARVAVAGESVGGSYEQFATGNDLSRRSMERFRDTYALGRSKRSEITASPDQACVEQLRGLPSTLVFVTEADVLCDEGEAYAAKHRSADVPVTTVRYDGTAHDFTLLNPLTDTRAIRASVDPATGFLCAALAAK